MLSHLVLPSILASGIGFSDSRDFGSGYCLFSDLFSARIFSVCFDFRADRFDGDERAGRRTICISAGDADARRILFQFCRHPRSEFDAFDLGFDYAVRRADDDADSHPFGNASVLANRRFDSRKSGDDHWFGLARLARLSRRNADVWQTRDDSRSLEMDQTELGKFNAKTQRRKAIYKKG